MLKKACPSECVHLTRSSRNLGWVDLEFNVSAVYPILLGLMEIWQKHAAGRDGFTPRSKLNQPKFQSKWDTLQIF